MAGLGDYSGHEELDALIVRYKSKRAIARCHKCYIIGVKHRHQITVIEDGGRTHQLRATTTDKLYRLVVEAIQHGDFPRLALTQEK